MEVGDYVRTKRGNIGKIIAYKDNSVSPFDVVLDCGAETDEEYVAKASKNIIDLIEVEDYVNGSYIYSVVEENNNTGQPRVLFTEEDGMLGVGDIKSIVTKEQFENMEYKIGG